LSNENDHELERLIRRLTGGPVDRRTLLRRTAGGAMGLSLASVIAACGGSSSSSGKQTKVIPKGQPAGTLNFSNWPLYIDRSVLKDFQKKYGTKVKYTEEINDNVEFFGKVRQQLARGSSGGRDLWALTDWMAGRMIRLGYVQKLDKSVLPNVEKNLLPAFRKADFDPARDYSAPWQGIFAGLIYRKDKIAEPKSVNDIFDPKLKGKVTMLTESRDTVGLTMLGMGKDPAKATMADINAALDKIDKANRDGQIRRFTGNDYTKDITKGDTWLIYGWSGDAVQLQNDNPNIRFFFPPEGFTLSSDNMQIPVGAPRAYTAELMMNFVYDPEVQAKIAKVVNYVTPVRGVREVLQKQDPKLAENQLIFPSDKLLENAHIFKKLTPAEEQELDSRFEQVIGA
jgi:spermidine/putrescine transport system substrate-binding protein